MLSHLLGQCTHTNAGKVIDGESGVPWVVYWEDAFKAGSDDIIFQSCLELWHAKCFCEILEQNLDEDTAAGSGLVFVQMDDR